MKSKTIAVWLTFLGGPLGLHRRYLLGRYDALARLLPIPTLLGLYGVYRARSIGLDDLWSWLLIPLLGFTIAACALNALVYGLMDTEKWNGRFNPAHPSEAAPGQTNWFTVAGLVVTLLLGTTALMASLAFSIQRYFEYQYNQSQAVSAAELRKSEY
jgi:hypothetical protein